MKILVVSPHPDDETLGAGGTLLKYKNAGHKIFWLNITDISETNGWDKDLVNHRNEQIRKIKLFYEFNGFYNLSFPPIKLSTIEDGLLIGKIKEVLEKIEPQWLIIPGHYDAHSDHRIVYNACMAVAKSFRAPYIKRIATMEILSETDYGFQKEKFEPNLFIDITDYMKKNWKQ